MPGGTPDPPRYRRPVPPAPLERYELSHPAVPPALDGLTILQIADLHVRTAQARDAAFQRTLDAISWAECDLVVLSGDYMTRPGDEIAAMDALERIRDAWKVRYGAFGVFGNHDSHAFKVMARTVEGITWVENRVEDLQGKGIPLIIAGASFPEDLLGTLIDSPHAAGAGTSDPVREHDPLTLAIVHYPTEIFPAADMGIPIVLAGHTHGGQIRPWKGYVPHTSSDIPSHLATGILRLRHTVCCVSRGVGEAYVGVRINCPRQMPLYTLRRGEALGGGSGGGEFGTLTQVVGW